MHLLNLNWFKRYIILNCLNAILRSIGRGQTSLDINQSLESKILFGNFTAKMMSLIYDN